MTSADGTTLLSIGVKAFAYLSTLLAIGGVIATAILSRLDKPGRAALMRMTAISAIAAALLSALHLPVRASFLMGGSIDGAVDPVMLGMVAESPLGDSILLRLVGLGLVLAILMPGSIALGVASVGAVLAAASFALRGHVLAEPRLILAALIILHTLGLAFWIGALAPLHRAAQEMPPQEAGGLADEFGRKALVVVGALVVAGAALWALLVGDTLEALSTPYGQGFAVKIALFIGVMGFAAFNKLRLTPALCSASPGAGSRLRRSIRLEALLIFAILFVTAAVTTLTTPPRPQSAAIQHEAIS